METATQTRYKAKPIGKVKGLGEVYQVGAPLPQQIHALEEKGVKHPFLVTPEETARIRIAGLSNDYTRTSFAPVGVYGEKPVLISISPFMDERMAVMAVDAHAGNEYPTQARKFYEIVKNVAEKESGLEPEDRTAHVLQSMEDYDLTPEMDDAKFILRGQTSKYFKTFNRPSIRFFNLDQDLMKKLTKDKCAVNYLWFYGPDYGSYLGCRGRLLGSGNLAFGVSDVSAKGASQNAKYSLTEVKNVVVPATQKTLEALSLSGLGDTGIATELEKNILTTLRQQ